MYFYEESKKCNKWLRWNWWPMPLLVMKGQRLNLNDQKEADDGANITHWGYANGMARNHRHLIFSASAWPKKIPRHERTELKYLLQTRLQLRHNIWWITWWPLVVWKCLHNSFLWLGNMLVPTSSASNFRSLPYATTATSSLRNQWGQMSYDIWKATRLQAVEVMSSGPPSRQPISITTGHP